MPKPSLTNDLEELTTLDRNQLLRRFRQLYDAMPPTTISRQLLLQVVAYRMQEKAHGGLKPASRLFLAQFATDKKANSISMTNLRIGTRLLREWHGITHEVTILEHGVLYNGTEYGSLTEVTRAITGSKWSGPAFFGLRGALSKPLLAKKRAAMDTEKMSVHEVHDIFEEAPLQADLKPKWVNRSAPRKKLHG